AQVGSVNLTGVRVDGGASLGRGNVRLLTKKLGKRPLHIFGPNQGNCGSAAIDNFNSSCLNFISAGDVHVGSCSSFLTSEIVDRAANLHKGDLGYFKKNTDPNKDGVSNEANFSNKGAGNFGPKNKCGKGGPVRIGRKLNRTIKYCGDMFKLVRITSISLFDSINSTVELINPQLNNGVGKDSSPSNGMRLEELGTHKQDVPISSFLDFLCEYNREYKPNIVSLLETRVSGGKVDKIIVSLGFQRSHMVKTVGFSR
ncbi:hypothetical protein Gotri_012359, partial [Gossypium trilobum]|nr:hypothetical protein [Gossypium trilobum]